MVILILAPNQVKRYNWGIHLFKLEIARQHRVLFYGPGHKRFNPSLTAPEILQNLPRRPGVVMTFGYKYTIPFKLLHEIQDIPKIHFMIEYLPKWEKKYDEFLLNAGYDLILANKQSEVPRFKKKGLAKRVEWMPFSVDTNIYRNRGLKRDVDVSFICTGVRRPEVYPNRGAVWRMLNEMPISTRTSYVIRKQYVAVLNRSKISVSSNSKFGYWSMRYTEIPACGAMLLADHAEDLDAVGMKHGKHFILYDGLSDLRRKIKKFLRKPEYRRIVAKNGEEFVRKHHSNEVRVKQLTWLLKEVVG